MLIVKHYSVNLLSVIMASYPAGTKKTTKKEKQN